MGAGNAIQRVTSTAEKRVSAEWANQRGKSTAEERVGADHANCRGSHFIALTRTSIVPLGIHRQVAGSARLVVAIRWIPGFSEDPRQVVVVADL